MDTTEIEQPKKENTMTPTEKRVFDEAYADFVSLCKLQGKELAVRCLELERLATEAEGNLSSDYSNLLIDHAFCVGSLAHKAQNLQVAVTRLADMGHLEEDVGKECVDAWTTGYPGLEAGDTGGCMAMSKQLERAWRIMLMHNNRSPGPKGRSPFSSGGANFAALLAAMANK